jgi:hypothetical protein
MRGDACSADVTLVHPKVEPVRSKGFLQRNDGLLGQVCQLIGLFSGEVDITSDMAIGAHQRVSRVIRVEIQHGERVCAASHDQR